MPTITALLLCMLGTVAPASGLAQQLLLTADVGKTTFFEDEPIYVLVRLQNVGTDTAWVSFFSLLSDAVTLSVHREDGKGVYVGRRIVDFLTTSTWRGEPLPPGASHPNTQLLQDLIGVEGDYRSYLFRNHLSPGQYDLQVEFDAHAGVPHAAPLKVTTAAIAFQIRARTLGEENEVKDLEAMREMRWDPVRAAGYRAALIAWAQQRLGDTPDDPFLPYLLYNALYAVGRSAEVRAPRFDPDTSEMVSRLRLAVIERNKLSTPGAHLVQGLTARHPDQLAVLAEQLKATPAGEMARYHVERNQHAQQFKNQPPR